MYKSFMRSHSGFSVIELIIVVSVIGLLATFISFNFNESRMNSRDEARKASLSQLRVALELYKAQYGRYPEPGCGGMNSMVQWLGPGPHSIWWANPNHCEEYIVGLAPEFIPELPNDPAFEDQDNRGFLYRVHASGSSYKVMVYGTVENQFIESFEDDFARCPAPVAGSPHCDTDTLQDDVYAIYSAGAENW